MKAETLAQLRQALLDNAAGHPLAQIHRNWLFELIEEAETWGIPSYGTAGDPLPIPMDVDVKPGKPPKPIKVEG